MIHCTAPDDIYRKDKVTIWLISAFKAGFINSAGFLLTGEFVSHVTGFGSRVGITMGHEEYLFGFELLLIPFSFILGAVFTSFILDKDYKQFEYPPYFKVQGLITTLIALIIILGELEIFSDQKAFGDDGRYEFVELFILSLLCFICGLKNGLVSWTTYGKVRVTHLTGTATDIGLNLIRMFNPKHPSPRFKEPIKMNYLRIALVLTFSAGAFISAVLFPIYGLRGFFIAFLLSFAMTLHSFFKPKSENFNQISL